MGYKGTPWSRTQYYRRKHRAAELGCSIYDLPGGRGKHGNHVSGEKHHRWNSDKITTSSGYVKIRVGTDHPLADPNGYAYEHTIVWVSAGRTLEPEDILHHINGCQQDNRLSNLERMSKENHNALHSKEHPRDRLGRFTKKAAGNLLDGETWEQVP